METRLLNLSSYDINSSDTLADYYNKTVSTPYGTVSNNRWSLTWNNIDFSKVMGDDFYNRYNFFKITLINFSLLPAPASKISTAVTAQHYQDFYVNWFLQGLPFFPGVSSALLDTGYIPMDQPFAGYTMNKSLSWMFTKVKLTNLSVHTKCVATDLPYNPGSDANYLWGHSFFSFEIVGVPEVIYPTPSSIVYGTPLLSSLNASVISGISGEIQYYLDNSKSISVDGTSIVNAGVSTIYADFVPADSFYSGFTQAASLQITQASTTTIFAQPSAITYGTDLSTSLNSTGSMPGTFTYFTDASFNNQVFGNTILNAGTHTIYSRLTPTSTNYAGSFDSKQIVVNKAPTTITFPNVTSILYGVTTGSTALSALLTGTTANISGGIYQFYLNNSSGTVITTSTILEAGTYIVYCEYTSQNDNYLSSSNSVSVTIQAHPTSATYSISTPTSIVYGTNLTSVLNATADLVQGVSVAGTLSYYRDASYNIEVFSSDILPYGNYTIYAVFRPTNTNDYLTSVVTTLLTVTQRPTVVTGTTQTVVYQSDITTGLTSTALTDIGGTVSGDFGFFSDNTYANTFASFASIVSYRYYKLLTTAIRTSTANIIQIGELNFRNNGVRVDYSTATASMPGGDSPSGYTPDKAIDGSLDTKWMTKDYSGLTYTVYDLYFGDNVNFFTNNTTYRTGGATSYTGVVTSISSVNAGTNNYVPSNSTWDFYSVQWLGFFKPDVTGVWTFYMNSDDAGYLWVGPTAASGFTTANALINNGGTHSTAIQKTGSITLTAGVFYDLRIQFGDNTAADNIILSFKGPAGSLAATATTNGSGFYYTQNADIMNKPLIVDFGKQTTISEYTFVTAPDLSDRDPVSWILYGSNDNSFWTPLDTKTNFATPLARKTYLSYFSLVDNLSVGNYTVYSRFVPSSTNYAISTSSYQLTVSPKPTTITFPNIVDVSYNASLSPFITGMTTSVAGTLTFTDANSNVLTTSSLYNAVGQFIINANFTPGSSNYASSSAAYLNLYSRFTPSFSFTTTSQSITYGADLSGVLTLNAPTFGGVAIAGTNTFYLSTIGGTVVTQSTYLVPATYTLMSTFVPTDSTKYYSVNASNSKTLTVGKKLLYPQISVFSTYLQSTPNNPINYSGLVLGDTSSNSMTFTSAPIFYFAYTTNQSYSNAVAQPKITEYDVYNTPITSGNTKSYSTYVELQNFSSTKYTQAFVNRALVMNKIPTQLTFSIPESVKTISYGTPITSSQLCGTIKNTLTNTVPPNSVIKYTLSATDLSQNITTNSVLNAGTYYVFANYVDASNIYMGGNTFSTRTNTITISKIKSTVAPPNISSIVYGTTLDSFITGTTKNAPGTVRHYKPSNN
jgi:hypothetical protein